MPKLIGLAGCIGSGKTEVAKHLGSKGFTIDAFGKSIKLGAAGVFGVPVSSFYGTPEDRAKIDPYWRISYRQMLQNFGTEAMQTAFGVNIWIEALWKRHQEVDYDLVIEDCRFPREADDVISRGGIVLEILRPTLETWENKRPWWWTPHLEDITSEQHASEIPLPRGLVTYQLLNDATIEQLHLVVDKILGLHDETN